MEVTTFHYEVQRGDTYWSIARKLVHDSEVYSSSAGNDTFVQKVVSGLQIYRGNKTLIASKTIILVNQIDFYLQIVSVKPQSQVSGTSTTNVITAGKKRGINFRCDLPSSGPAIKVNANGFIDREIPFNENFLYSTNDKTVSGPLEIAIGASRKKLCPDMSVLKVQKPEDLFIYMGSEGALQNRTVSDLRWQSTPQTFSEARDTSAVINEDTQSETVVVLEAKTAPAVHVPEGTYSTESAGDSLLKWIITEMLGTNIPPLMKDLTEMGSVQAKRQFLSDLFFKGTFVIKVNPSNGSRYIIFKGYAGLRTHMNAPRYLTSNAKVSIISMYADMASGTKAGTSSAVKSATKGNVVAFVIVGSLDVAEYIFNPDKGKMLSDLMVDLGIDFGKVMLSGYAGLLSGAAVVAIAGAMSVSAPVWVVIGVAVGVSIAVGFGLDALDNQFGFTSGIKNSIKTFYRDMHIDQALEQSVAVFRSTWSSLSMPCWKIYELRKVILSAPKQLSGFRPSKASTPELIAAIMLDVMQEHSDLRIIKKTLLDTEAKFIEVYEGSAESSERWLFTTFTGKTIEKTGIGLGHMSAETVYDLVDNNYLRHDKALVNDRLDVALSWLNDERRVPVLVGARLARISQYWYSKSNGTVDISDKPEILASLYYTGLASSKGVHGKSQPNEAGIRIKNLIPTVKLLLATP